MTIYYDSKTGNVERFIQKMHHLTDWNYIKISDSITICEPGHLITFTTQIGKVPSSTTAFLDQWHHYILSVSSSGNKNWGIYFGLAANIISKEYNIPLLLKFELSGLEKDLNYFIKKVTDYANQKMDIPQQ